MQRRGVIGQAPTACGKFSGKWLRALGTEMPRSATSARLIGDILYKLPVLQLPRVILTDCEHVFDSASKVKWCAVWHNERANFRNAFDHTLLTNPCIFQDFSIGVIWSSHFLMPADPSSLCTRCVATDTHTQARSVHTNSNCVYHQCRYHRFSAACTSHCVAFPVSTVYEMGLVNRAVAVGRSMATT